MPVRRRGDGSGIPDSRGHYVLNSAGHLMLREAILCHTGFEARTVVFVHNLLQPRAETFRGSRARVASCGENSARLRACPPEMPFR